MKLSKPSVAITYLWALYPNFPPHHLTLWTCTMVFQYVRHWTILHQIQSPPLTLQSLLSWPKFHIKIQGRVHLAIDSAVSSALESGMSPEVILRICTHSPAENSFIQEDRTMGKSLSIYLTTHLFFQTKKVKQKGFISNIFTTKRLWKKFFEIMRNTVTPKYSTHFGVLSNGFCLGVFSTCLYCTCSVMNSPLTKTWALYVPIKCFIIIMKE
jgi:hypothetical protein